MKETRKQVSDDRETKKAKEYQVFFVPPSLFKNVIIHRVFQSNKPQRPYEAIRETFYETAISTEDHHSKEYQSQT